MTPDEQERAVVYSALAVTGAALVAAGVPYVKALLLCILALLAVLFTNPLARWRLRKFPGPPYRPLVGNLPDIVSLGSHAFFDQCRAAYGPVFAVWFGARPWVVVADADMGRRANYRLLNRPGAMANPLASGDVLQSVLEGLFLSRDATWSMLRKVWQPAFHSESLAGYRPAMAAEARRLADRLHATAQGGEGGVVDVWREVGRMTMAVVGSTAYGVDFRLGDDSDGGAEADGGGKAGGGKAESKDATAAAPVGAGLVQAAATMFKASELSEATRYAVAAHLMPVLLPALRCLADRFPDDRYRRLVRAREHLRSTSLGLIEHTRSLGPRASQPASSASPSCAANRPAGVAPGSFLGLLLAARDKEGHALTDRQMAAQANVFTLAGYETTANTLAYAIYCLAAHPEAQARVLAELDALPGPQGRDVTLEDLERLPYIAAVIDEALRLYPPGASTMREARGGLSLGGFAVPDGVTVVVATYSIQRDPAYWPKADAFLPERWLPGGEELAATNANAYLPFGSGARMCIGYRFALQEARLTLAQLYRSLTFELAPGQVPLRVRTGITMSPADGVMVRVVPRPAPAASA